MRHIHKRRVRILVQPLELRAHLHAQLGIKVGQRFIHEQDLGSRSQRSGDGDALLLTAGEFTGIAALELFNAQHFQQFIGALADPLLVPLEVLQTEGDVLIHRHVRPERVVLEQKAHIALVGRKIDAAVRVKNDFSINGDAALCRGFQAGNHAQRGCFAAAGRPEQRDERIAFNIQIEVVHGHKFAEALGYIVQSDFRHLNHLLPCRLTHRSVC